MADGDRRDGRTRRRSAGCSSRSAAGPSRIARSSSGGRSLRSPVRGRSTAPRGRRLEAVAPAEEGRPTAVRRGAQASATVAPSAQRRGSRRARRRTIRRRTCRRLRVDRPATLRRHEQEPRSLLVVVPSRQPAGIGLERHVHLLRRARYPVSSAPGNFT